jgi:ABC-2 type transport system ATP-binding protein
VTDGAPRNVGAELESVTRRFGSRVALHDASFTLEPGEVLGLLGPNGAGKTTTMRLLTGYLHPSAGRVTVGGADVTADPVRARRLIGYLPEAAPVPADMTVVAFLAYCARLRGLARRQRKPEVKRVASLAGVADVQSRYIGSLSRGYRQRVGLAQALIGDPPVLILDEPTVGLDPRQVVATRELIARLGRKHAVLLSSHLLSEVDQLCRRVVVLDRGAVLATAAVRDLTGGAARIVVKLAGADADRAAGLLRSL